jgi:hypothetical protein
LGFSELARAGPEGFAARLLSADSSILGFLVLFLHSFIMAEQERSSSCRGIDRQLVEAET